MSVTGRSNEELHERAAAEAAQRYEDSAAERERVEGRMAAGVRFPDNPDALAVRADRILDRGGLSPSAVVADIRGEAMDLPQANERIIDLSNELQAWSFLPRGVRAGATVARITLRRDGRELPHGTGFLVSPRLLMTNHHVLPDEAFARQCFAEFNAQVTVDNVPDTAVRMELDPGTFFTADQRLDFALVAVVPTQDGRKPGEVFGWNRLSVQLGKLVLGEKVNIIGHPDGRLKEIVLRDNAVLVRLDDFVQYRTDTRPGNSGSPVFNDQWEVVALHHSGVPKKDDQGRVLRKDGRPWSQGDGDDAIDWVANEGVRISSILKHLARLDLDAGRRALLAEMGPDSGLDQSTAAPVPQPEGATPAVPGITTPSVPGTPVTVAMTASETRTRTPEKGRPARSTAFGGRRHLVFLHGRDQQGKKPDDLRRQWTSGLNHGLTLAALPTVDPEDVWFPFYGTRLADLVAGRESTAQAVGLDEVSAAAAAEVFAAESPTGSYEQLLYEAAARAGMPQNGPAATEGFGAGLVGALHRPLSWLAARSDLDEWTIATFLRDVDLYLGDSAVRQAVLDSVLETMPATGELVLVTHSLGTVVGMDLLTRLPQGLDPVLLVTAGSPLGLDGVNERLLARGPHRPPKVRDWVNVWCPTDAVAVGCPLADERWGKLTQLAVQNGRDRAHKIEEYLAHTGPAKEIGTVLTRPF
ncbi:MULTISPECIES: trypsin-like serine peptidase [Streptomyces]|uniref:Serine protease n=1 Tax=Streptomyces chartreusis NRRL 3882 TaxID=1079985 RepID=A0A2N9B7F3_STRCX|nr:MULTISPECIES: serine protease [Streptomyces]MYS92214.1 serine protease [Streptomyces sp. SID5464]SOR79267.1 Glutamyl endopeptidase precursor [Streptomyces chartreusis NRRL 3882]